MLIDTHCHLDFNKFDSDRDEVIARAAGAGVMRIVIPALDVENSRAVLRLAEQYKGVYAAVGVHPNSTAGWRDQWLGVLRDLARHERVVAIGEIGLDYYWDKSPKPVQQRAFAMQLELASELGLPVIIHNREAGADVIGALAESSLAGRANAGVLHSFSADWETAQAALEMGFYLGFTGPVTFKKASELRRVAADMPLDRLLIETDAPFLSPEPHRGKRNEPAYVRLVARKVADVRELPLSEVEERTTENAIRLFGEKLA